MSHHPRKPAGRSDGPLGPSLQLFQIVSILPWARCRDDLMQFFLMIKLFDMHANAKDAEAEAKFGPYRARVNTYLDEVNNVKKAKGEGDAVKIVSAACDKMKIVLKSVNLDPATHAKTKDRWKDAENCKKDFKDESSPLPGTHAVEEQKPPIPVDVGISYDAEELTTQETRELAFPKSFEKWPLSALVSYSLAHPGKLGQTEESEGSESSIEPIKRQAMDAVHLRTPYKKSRTCWIPLDYHARLTLEECAAKIEEKPDTTEVRFISCKPRFVVMAAYDETDSTEVEKIINLEDQGKMKRLKEALKQRELRNVTSKAAPESTRGKGKGKNEGKEPEDECAKTERDDPACSTKDDDQRRKFDTKALLRTLEPRSCLLLLGPDPLPAESGKKGDKSKMAT